MKRTVAIACRVAAVFALMCFARVSSAQKPLRTAVADFNCVAPKSVTADVKWTAQDAAMKVGEWKVALGPNAVPVLVVVAIIAPGTTSLALDVARDGDQIGPWTLANAPANARVALNAGQFTDTGPWGWVVHRGREHQPPGAGSLGGAFVVDTTGRWSLLDATEITARRGRNVLEAVQSYPTLLAADGKPPRVLCANSDSVNRSHRDTRLAIGTLPNGHLLIAMTRFDGLGETVGRLPIGPTTPEMISIMRALGATRALMLDGGLSAQLLTRTGSAATKREWPGLRSVPLAIVGLPVSK